MLPYHPQMFVIPGRPVRAGPGTHEHGPCSGGTTTDALCMGSGLAAVPRPGMTKISRNFVSNSEMSAMNPQRTVELLDELERLGFTNEAFWRLHHFREKGNRDTINSHRSYCEKTDSFKDGDNNERVQVRPEMVLKYYELYHNGHPDMFTRLADAAYCMVPALAY